MLLETPICDFGWKAPDFTLKDPDGNTYNMTEQIGDKGLLVMFICNHCPFVKAITDRLSKDSSILIAQGINVLAVMSNDYHHVPTDAPQKMKEFAIRHQFPFPYLVDEDQSVGKAYNAVCTPDFFGLNKNGELQYRGRLDDTGMDNNTKRTPELLNAMQLIAKTGSGPKQQHASMGCSIKWR